MRPNPTTFESYSLFKNTGQLSWRIILAFLRSLLSCYWPSFQFQLNYKVQYVMLNLQNKCKEHNHPPWNPKFKLLAGSPSISENVQTWSSLLSLSSPSSSLASLSSQLWYYHVKCWGKTRKSNIKTLSSLGVWI